MFTCTRFGLLRFVSNWERPTTCSKRSRIGEFGTSLLAMDSSSPYWFESLISSLFLLRDVLFWVIVSIAGLIEDSNGWWRSLSSFKPCKTWEDCPVDITFERVTVFFTKILHAAVFLCLLLNSVSSEHCLLQCTQSIGTLIGSSGAKDQRASIRHTLVAISRGQRAGILSICKCQRPFLRCMEFLFK